MGADVESTVAWLGDRQAELTWADQSDTLLWVDPETDPVWLTQDEDLLWFDPIDRVIE